MSNNISPPHLQSREVKKEAAHVQTREQSIKAWTIVVEKQKEWKMGEEIWRENRPV